MIKLDTQTLQLALVAMVALAMLLQAIVLLAVFIVIRKAVRAMRQDLENLRSSVMPIVDNTNELFRRVAPKVETTAEDLAAMTHSLRAQIADVQSAAAEIIARVRHEANRFDSMLSNLLDVVDRAGAFMTDTVAKPMRQLSGLLAAVKAVVESLRAAEHASPSQPNRAQDDGDMFV